MRKFGVLTALFVLAGFGGADADPTPTSGPASKTYTLGDVNNEHLATNPTNDWIEKAIASLDNEKNEAVYLKIDETHCIQANYEGKNQLSFEYVDGGDEHMFLTKTKTYSRDTAVKLFMSYMSGKDDWLKMVDWEPMK